MHALLIPFLACLPTSPASAGRALTCLPCLPCPALACLQSNSELSSVFVDRSYSPNQQVAAGYFQVGTGIPGTCGIQVYQGEGGQ